MFAMSSGKTKIEENPNDRGTSVMARHAAIEGMGENVCNATTKVM